MRNHLISIVGIFVFCLFIAINSWADCPHCYRIAKVELAGRDGVKHVGYMTIFYGMYDYSEYDTIESGSDLIPILDLSWHDVSFFNEYHRFEGVGPVVATEHIERIDSTTVSSMTFLNWEDFQGACNLPSLPESVIVALQQHEILHIDEVEGQGLDCKYINIRSEITEREFRFLVKHVVGGGGKPYPCMRAFSRRRDPMRYERSNRVPLTEQVMLEEISRCEKATRDNLREVDEILNTDKPEILERVPTIRDLYETRLAACECVTSYLTSGDISSWENLLSLHKDHPILLHQRVPTIPAESDPDKTLEYAQMMCRTLRHFIRHTPDQDKLTEILDKLNIIRIVYWYD